jgi:ferredoxin--NADP+ reductase
MSNFQIAIIGAGPAGYFAAQALQNSQTDDLTFSIDMFEKLPTPWGLVRSGVAPDHPKIKSVSKVFEKIATSDGFRLFCNVELGKDVTLSELQNNYDAVVVAIGASKGRKLGIPGEELKGSLSAAEFVPWYNGHPDFAKLNVPLDSKSALVIGAGNVAMDVARILALEPDELEPTDTALHALSALHESQIREVHLCARRGPEHAAFTSPELRELPKLEHTSIFISEEEIIEAQSRIRNDDSTESENNKNLDAMLAIAQSNKPKQNRSIEFHFLLTPIEIKGSSQVEEVVFKVNKVIDGKVQSTDETFSIKCGLVVTAIGYETDMFEDLEFENGRIKNDAGRVSGENIYVVGWAKRGPSGVIGTNKSDSSEVMKLLIEDLKSPKVTTDIEKLLSVKGAVHLSQEHWQQINNAEIQAGESKGKPRIKFTDRDEMISFKNV